MEKFDARLFILNKDPISSKKLYWLYLVERYLEPYEVELDYSKLVLDTDKELISSEIYPLLAELNSKGYLNINHTFLNSDEKLDNLKYEFLIEPKEEYKTILEGQKDNELLYKVDIEGVIDEAKKTYFGINWRNTSSFLLHLTAIFVIEEVLKGRNTSLMFEANSVVKSNPHVLVFFYDILEYLPLKSTIGLYGLNQYEKMVLGLSAWIGEHKDRGYLTEESVSIEVKKDFFDKKDYFYEGAVVYLYERKTTFNSHSKDLILDCRLAIIREVSEEHIKLQEVSLTVTPSQLEHDFNSLPNSVLKMYNYEYPKQEFKVKTYDWYSMGIEYLMADKEHYLQERNFIMPLQEKGEGVVTQKVNIGDGLVIDKSMSYNEAVYHILTESDLIFDEERFKQIYLTESEVEDIAD